MTLMRYIIIYDQMLEGEILESMVNVDFKEYSLEISVVDEEGITNSLNFSRQCFSYRNTEFCGIRDFLDLYPKFPPLC